ncbi:hypothetical protein HYV73_03235 [Candidatus Uhrbacteria bacterium]|nr:hypothetical protein [Candidatus Uhrbacteria bacterium]
MKKSEMVRCGGCSLEWPIGWPLRRSEHVGFASLYLTGENHVGSWEPYVRCFWCVKGRPGGPGKFQSLPAFLQRLGKLPADLNPWSLLSPPEWRDQFEYLPAKREPLISSAREMRVQDGTMLPAGMVSSPVVSFPDTTRWPQGPAVVRVACQRRDGLVPSPRKPVRAIGLWKVWAGVSMWDETAAILSLDRAFRRSVWIEFWPEQKRWSEQSLLEASRFNLEMAEAREGQVGFSARCFQERIFSRIHVLESDRDEKVWPEQQEGERQSILTWRPPSGYKPSPSRVHLAALAAEKSPRPEPDTERRLQATVTM